MLRTSTGCALNMLPVWDAHVSISLLLAICLYVFVDSPLFDQCCIMGEYGRTCFSTGKHVSVCARQPGTQGLE